MKLVKEYDEKGNLTRCKDSLGNESWWEYDENGKMVHCKKSSGVERWEKYNREGNLIYYKDSNGCEIWFEIDISTEPIGGKNETDQKIL